MRAHRYVRKGRADDADVAGAAAGDTHEPAAVIGLHTPRRAKLAAAPAQGFAGGTPLHCEYSKHRGGNAGRVLRVLAAHAVRHCAASAVRSRRTGAAVRGHSRGYSAVRRHRDVREGRADDADVTGGAVAGDTHEPAVIGLHTARRAKLAAAPAQRSAGGTPLRCEY